MDDNNDIFIKNLIQTVTLQCKNNLSFNNDMKIQGMLAVTMDSSNILLIHFDESLPKTSQYNQGNWENMRLMQRGNSDSSYDAFVPPINPMYSFNGNVKPIAPKCLNRPVLSKQIISRGMCTPKKSNRIPVRKFYTPQFKNHLSLENKPKVSRTLYRNKSLEVVDSDYSFPKNSSILRTFAKQFKKDDLVINIPDNNCIKPDVNESVTILSDEEVISNETNNHSVKVENMVRKFDVN